MQSERAPGYGRNGTPSVKPDRHGRPVANTAAQQPEHANSERVTHQSTRRNRRVKNRLLIAILAIFLVAFSPFSIVELIKATNESKTYSTVQSIPARPVAIVFGAGLQRNGSPSWMLADRLDAAVALYKAGKVGILLLTGDEVTSQEISAMRSYAIDKGVPSAKILSDKAGLRTYDSCYRANHNFGINSAVLVTQAYHLPRALYLCNALGVDAVGFKAGQENYPNQSYYNQREFLATFLSWVDISITRPKPEIVD
jgi:vancomycin permeability regulator SanA